MEKSMIFYSMKDGLCFDYLMDVNSNTKILKKICPSSSYFNKKGCDLL